MHSLRSTERYLVLLKAPFNAKSCRKNRMLSSVQYKGTRRQACSQYPRRGNVIHQPRSIVMFNELTTRSLVSKVPPPLIKVPLINPEKPSSEDLKNVKIEPIVPLSMSRFPKQSETLPSVTKILSATMPAASQHILDRWKESMIKKLGVAGFNKYQAETFERGRLLHTLIATYLLDHKEPQDIGKEIVANLWKSMGNVVKENLSNVRLVEHAVTHSQMKYRGIVDCVAFYKDELAVIDFKTAEKPKKNIESLYDNPLQVTAYCAAINNESTIPKDVIDRNISAGVVIVAYIDGSEASVHYFGRDQLLDELWNKWTVRLDQYCRLEAMRQAKATGA